MNWLIFAVSLAVSGLAMPLLMKLAYKVGALDSPNTDVMTHTRSTPLLGGLAVIISTLMALTIFVQWNVPLAILLGLSMLCLMGLYKDISRKDLQPLLQLTIQVLFCLLVVSSLVPVEKLQIWQTGLFIVGGVALINAINFLDVSDGLCAAVVITIALGLFFAGGSIFSLSLAGGLLGFFFWNHPKAKIFMGDVGSFFIGGTLFIVAIDGLFFSEWHWVMLTVFILPFAELGFTMLMRLSKSRAIMQGDTSHASLILLNSGMSPWLLIASFTGATVLTVIPAIILSP